MTPMFDTTPIRVAARRGHSSFAIKRTREGWPPPGRDPVDVALVAVRLLSLSGRLRSRLRRTATEAGVERDMILLLLLWAESKRSLRQGNREPPGHPCGSGRADRQGHELA